MKEIHPVGFSLIPAQPFLRSFSELITALASEHGAPVFEPHITLHVGERTPDDDIAMLLGRIAATTGPIELVAGETGHGPARFKTLFVAFDDPRLQVLHAQFRRGLTQLSDYTLAPHLSLLYKELPESSRRPLARRYVFCGERIVFDQIAAVRPAPEQGDWSDVGGWDAWLRQPLHRRNDPPIIAVRGKLVR